MRKILIIILFIILSIFIWTQYRHFYRVADLTFTVWKRTDGYCYITPYAYWGFSSPKDDYIRASNIGQIDIYIDNDSTLLVFNSYHHLEYKNEIECYLRKYKYRHFEASPSYNDKSWELKRIKYRNNLPFIEINIREMNVSTNNSLRKRMNDS